MHVEMAFEWSYATTDPDWCPEWRIGTCVFTAPVTLVLPSAHGSLKGGGPSGYAFKTVIFPLISQPPGVSLRNTSRTFVPRDTLGRK